MHRKHISFSLPIVAFGFIAVWFLYVAGSWNDTFNRFATQKSFGNGQKSSSSVNRKLDGTSRQGSALDSQLVSQFRFGQLPDTGTEGNDWHAYDGQLYTAGDRWFSVSAEDQKKNEDQKKELQKIRALPLIEKNFLKGAVYRHAKKLCHLVGNEIAVVGNGPVSDEDRTRISKADTVMRFNSYHKTRRSGERTDLWVLRHNERPPLWYWGIESLTPYALSTIARSVTGMVFLGGLSDMVESLFENIFIDVPKEKAIFFPTDSIESKYFNIFGIMGDVATMPSSGLLGVLMMLGCYRKNSSVHLYGFNFSEKNYHAHIMHAEEFLMQQLQKTYNITIHETPCKALHSCAELLPKEPSKPLFSFSENPFDDVQGEDPLKLPPTMRNYEDVFEKFMAGADFGDDNVVVGGTQPTVGSSKSGKFTSEVLTMSDILHENKKKDGLETLGDTKGSRSRASEWIGGWDD